MRLAGRPGPEPLGPHGPWVVTTAEQARAVLTDPVRFDFPTDVSRRAAPRRDETPASSRSPHSITPPLSPDAVARGEATFVAELDLVTRAGLPSRDADAMVLLRDPVARSTVDAVLPGLDPGDRAQVGGLTLAWIDALGPVIARSRPPSRWSPLRRSEARAKQALLVALDGLGVADPEATATVLAAGIQVPIAAGAWLLVKLAENPLVLETVRARPDLSRAVAWETVRLCPPTWITARIAREATTLDDVPLPAQAVVLVSPLLLGRSGQLVPLAPGADPADFDPLRWDQDTVRPGAWLPFGAGPHACPGRNLGLAQLTRLASWATRWSIAMVEPARVDQSRGIFPRPARLSFEER